MTGGAALLMSMMYGLRANGLWHAPRAGNILDGSAYFYTCYACSDGGWMAVGAIEPEFRLQMLQLLGLGTEANSIMASPDGDPGVRARLAQIFRGRTRAHWQKVFDGTDACVSPVLGLDEVGSHEQNRAAGNFVLLDGVLHPAPAPRFSRTPPPFPADSASAENRQAQLQAWGLELTDIE
jgi:alpha-methylacyl-CoA racemase